MKSQENCGVCGKALLYRVDAKESRCFFCGEEGRPNIYCPDGHYICDTCHQGEALEILSQVTNTSKSKDPHQIAEMVMSHPVVPMHGPEHHAIVPASIVAAVRNAGYTVPDNAIEKAITRGMKVPGGWCGFYGDCGAAVGVGIAVSVLTGATPLTGKQRSLAMEATAFTLNHIIDGHPRCCKRMSRKGIGAAVEFLRDRLDIILDVGKLVLCDYSHRNKECPKDDCAYYGEMGSLS